MVRRNKKIACFAATLLSTTMFLSTGLNALAYTGVNVRTQSLTQMVSDKEVVYVNNITKDVERTVNFDSNWKFYLGDAGQAEGVIYDDSNWRNVSLPHDYSIEQKFQENMEAESGYLPGGIGWYRKNFNLSKDLEGKRFKINFDGVYMNSTIWINGVKLGTHPYGYSPFTFDITDHLKFGEENVIAVKVDHKTPSSRWYSGSGIYRSVNLMVTNPVHVGMNGIKIETPELKNNQNDVKTEVKANILNETNEEKEIKVRVEVYKKNDLNNVVSFVENDLSIPANNSKDTTLNLSVKKPELWSIENPNLYVVRTIIKEGDKVIDEYDTDYGFRYFEFKRETGFYLNGNPVKLKGVSMHHDQGALGAVANRRAIERQVEILKEMGTNSIRVTHNPAAQNLIDVCNEKGILVVEEIYDGWHRPKNGNIEDFAKYFSSEIGNDNKLLGSKSDMTWAEFSLKSTLERDKNAPSVIMWSLGNEIEEGAGGSGYLAHAKNLIKWAQEIDKTRPVTVGSNKVKSNHQEMIEVGNEITKAGGISGLNYSSGNQYDSIYGKHSDWTIYGAETASSINSRGIYKDTNQQLSSYDNSKVGWGAYANDAWYDVITRDYVAGEYVWTGFDYIGEPTPWNGTSPGPQGKWKSPKNSYFGIIDTAGLPKDSYYLYQSQWNDDVNTLHILPVWDERAIKKDSEGKVEVVVYSDADNVELWLTPKGSNEAKKVGEKKSLITKTTEAGYKYKVSKEEESKLYRKWKVPFEEGTLEARIVDENGKQIKAKTVGRSVVKTTGEAAKLRVTADRSNIAADGKDLSYLTIDVLDANGNIVPDANDMVKVEVSGAGTLVGLDNGSSPDHDSYKGTQRRVFNGQGIAIIQSTKNEGEIKVKLSAEGLEGQEVVLNTKAIEGNSSDDVQITGFLMSRNYYVKVGNKPELPKTIETRYSNGATELKSVKWDEIPEDKIQSLDRFVVSGVVDGKEKVSVVVNMIGDVGGLLNYSTAVVVGSEPSLPNTRPAYLSDGTLLDIEFPVKWEVKDKSEYSNPGNVTIAGTANVLGKDVNVKANVRVDNSTVDIGGSVSSSAYLTQNIPDGKQSDTLDAIKDGQTEISPNMSGGPNKTIWSNYTYSQDGHTESEITFRYDTQQTIGEIVVHFAKDAGSLRYPDANTTKIYISETGTEGSWKEVNVTEKQGAEKSNVKPYTYSFAPFSATFVKFKIKNSATKDTGSVKPSTGITEIELKKATTKFTHNSTAELESLTVNGVELTESQLLSGSYKTSAIIADIKAVSKDNAAITILPKNNNKIIIVIESEDHETINNFVINLGGEDEDVYYPNSKLQASADSEYNGDGNEGPARFVIDDKLNTHWHTNWKTSEATDVAKRHITLTLEEATTIDAMNYHPRVQGGGNGRLSEYKILYSEDGTTFPETNVCATGELDINKAEWITLTFNKPVKAKAFRLVGVHTASNGTVDDKHMAVSELKLRVFTEKTDIYDSKNKVTVDKIENQLVDIVNDKNPVEPKLVVRHDQIELKYGIDYKVEYKDNTKVGIATAIVTGIGKYSGTIEVKFNIEQKEATLTNISIKEWNKTDYYVGDKLNPEGLVLTLFYSDGTSKEVAYNTETSKDFIFNPSLDKSLEESDTKVVVTYNNKTTEINISVSKKISFRPQLQQKVDELSNITQNGYTEDSYEVFKNALENAKNVLANENATEEEIEKALNNLNIAFNGLKLETQENNPEENNPEESNKELYDYLNNFYNECLNFYKEDNYSKELWEEYKNALANAESILNKKDATEKELKDALTYLVEVTEKMDEEFKGDKPSPNAPQTGDNLAIMPIVLVMLISVGVILFVVKKREQEVK